MNVKMHLHPILHSFPVDFMHLHSILYSFPVDFMNRKYATVRYTYTHKFKI